MLLIGEFLREKGLKLTGSQIAKKKKLNQKTVANHLNRLEKQHMLKSITQGKNKLYQLNTNNEIITDYLTAIEHLRTVEFYKKNILIKDISQKIKEHIKGIAIIFGSYAKGNQKKDSDLDILVIGKCNEKEITKIAKMYKIDINLKIYKQLKDDILTREVIKNHIIIKNAEQFVEKWIRSNGA